MRHFTDEELDAAVNVLRNTVRGSICIPTKWMLIGEKTSNGYVIIFHTASLGVVGHFPVLVLRGFLEGDKCENLYASRTNIFDDDIEILRQKIIRSVEERRD